jgi:hypothetical protein
MVCDVNFRAPNDKAAANADGAELEDELDCVDAAFLLGWRFN